MKFDYVIGNPPYQDETVGDNETYAPQIYYKFMDASYSVGKAVELIHPGRFLFNAGSTPKAWNEKLLNDPHFKILHYEPDTHKIFPSASITGGIAISYRNESKEYGSIGVFTVFPELNTILHKVSTHSSFISIEPMVITRTIYRLTDKMHQDHPEAISQLSRGHAYDMSSNIFERLPQIFYNQSPIDGNKYIRMLGRIGTERVYKYIRRDYVKEVVNTDKFKIVLARADGAAGTIGNPIPARIIGQPIIEIPGTGTTESFLSIGSLSSQEEAIALLQYIKTKFVRTLVGILKTTQDINPGKWKYVPAQDYTLSSDIDWSQPVSDIDRQLYRKYSLSDEEIAFIETHVKEME